MGKACSNIWKDSKLNPNRATMITACSYGGYSKNNIKKLGYRFKEGYYYLVYNCPVSLLIFLRVLSLKLEDWGMKKMVSSTALSIPNP